MDVKEFFDKYSIEEISKRTKISSISLEYIKNREFDKFTKVKFLGFVKLIEQEFKINLDELREEYNNFALEATDEKKEKNESNKSSNNLVILILALLLIGSGVYVYKNHINKLEKSYASSIDNNETNKIDNLEQNTIENNRIFAENVDNNDTNESNITMKENSVLEVNSSHIVEEKNSAVETNSTKLNLKEQISIIPHNKLWFKAVNLDNNKTFEYLTSSEKNLTGRNFYIKLGHGDVTIEYNDLNITPHTKKVVRILLKDGNYTYLTEDNRFEK